MHVVDSMITTSTNQNEQTYQSTDIWLGILTFIDTGSQTLYQIMNKISPVDSFYMPGQRWPASQPGLAPQDLVMGS